MEKLCLVNGKMQENKIITVNKLLKPQEIEPFFLIEDLDKFLYLTQNVKNIQSPLADWGRRIKLKN